MGVGPSLVPMGISTVEFHQTEIKEQHDLNDSVSNEFDFFLNLKPDNLTSEFRYEPPLSRSFFIPTVRRLLLLAHRTPPVVSLSQECAQLDLPAVSLFSACKQLDQLSLSRSQLLWLSLSLSPCDSGLRGDREDPFDCALLHRHSDGSLFRALSLYHFSLALRNSSQLGERFAGKVATGFRRWTTLGRSRGGEVNARGGEGQAWEDFRELGILSVKKEGPGQKLCSGCGLRGMKFVLCETCLVSCKLFVSEDGEEENGGFVRCKVCNINGLIRCTLCCLLCNMCSD